MASLKKSRQNPPRTTAVKRKCYQLTNSGECKNQYFAMEIVRYWFHLRYLQLLIHLQRKMSIILIHDDCAQEKASVQYMYVQTIQTHHEPLDQRLCFDYYWRIVLYSHQALCYYCGDGWYWYQGESYWRSNGSVRFAIHPPYLLWRSRIRCYSMMDCDHCYQILHSTLRTRYRGRTKSRLSQLTRQMLLPEEVCRMLLFGGHGMTIRRTCRRSLLVVVPPRPPLPSMSHE